MGTKFDIEDPKTVALLANLVRAFRARHVELCFDEEQMMILERLQGEGLVDLTNDGFHLAGGASRYAATSQKPPVTPRGILFLERLPIDKFVDQPGLFRFLGWL